MFRTATDLCRAQKHFEIKEKVSFENDILIELPKKQGKV